MKKSSQSTGLSDSIESWLNINSLCVLLGERFEDEKKVKGPAGRSWEVKLNGTPASTLN